MNLTNKKEKKILEGLSAEEKESVEKILLIQKLQDREQVRLWLIKYLGVDLANCTVSRFSTSNPLDMVWDVYSFCANNSNEEPIDLRYIAGRASQKTLSLACLKVLIPLHFKRPVVHFGGTKAQAKRAYTYFRKFVIRPHVKDYLKSEPTQEKTTFVVDGEEIEIEILSLSLMAVQGAHAPLISLDELASLAPDKVKAYEDVNGIPVYTKDGKPWIKFGISSRKGAYTVIEKEYEERDKTGTVFKFWTVLENTKQCPDSISGTEPYSYYANAIDNKVVTPQDWEKLDQKNQSKYDLVHAKNGCFTCPLSAICAGDLKRQTSTCKTLRPTKAVIQEFKKADLQWFLSQSMSMTPSLEGLVFPKFKRENFEKTATELYEIFTGTKADKEWSGEELIEFMLSKGVKVYAGLDHGYSPDPMVLIVTLEDSTGRIFVVSVTPETELDPEQLRDLVVTKWKDCPFTHLYPDPAGPAENALLKKAKKFRVIDEFDKKGGIELGISLIRQKISPNTGGTKLYGLKGEVDFFVKEMEKYHNEMDAAGKILDYPADEFNHSIDALRYIAINRWKNENKIVIGKDSDKPKTEAEIRIHQNAEIAKQNENWLKREIDKSIGGDQTAQMGAKKSKGGGFFWGI